MPILSSCVIILYEPLTRSRPHVPLRFPACAHSLVCVHGPSSAMASRAFGEDEFPVAWHPHRGMDILTYIVQGQGRHADSLGNRSTFDSPGMQWIRCVARSCAAAAAAACSDM